MLSKWLGQFVEKVLLCTQRDYLVSGSTPHTHLLEDPSGFVHTHLYRVASQGSGPFKPPALLLGHHEQLGQALLHDPGEALVVQAH